MSAAIALAVMLVVAVAGLSFAMQAQRPDQPASPRPVRPRPQLRQPRERTQATPASESAPRPEPAGKEAEQKPPDLLQSGVSARATVLAVVDERKIGPVTRSKLTLNVEPEGGDAFEVSFRMAFPTPEERARISVGDSVPVKYDKDNHRRVVLDLPKLN